MEFKEKNRTARELASPEFIEKDRNLLESIHPGHELLSRCNIASRRRHWIVRFCTFCWIHLLRRKLSTIVLE